MKLFPLFILLFTMLVVSNFSAGKHIRVDQTCYSPNKPSHFSLCSFYLCKRTACRSTTYAKKVFSLSRLIFFMLLSVFLPFHCISFYLCFYMYLSVPHPYFFVPIHTFSCVFAHFSLSLPQGGKQNRIGSGWKKGIE